MISIKKGGSGNILYWTFHITTTRWICRKYQYPVKARLPVTILTFPIWGVQDTYRKSYVKERKSSKKIIIKGRQLGPVTEFMLIL